MTLLQEKKNEVTTLYNNLIQFCSAFTLFDLQQDICLCCLIAMSTTIYIETKVSLCRYN